MSTQTHQLSAAEALAALIPTTTPVTAALADPASPKPTGNAVSASFIGSVSADLSIVLADIGSVAGAGASDLLSLTDVLRPALEAATAGLGAGVLDEARVDKRLATKYCDRKRPASTLPRPCSPTPKLRSSR